MKKFIGILLICIGLASIAYTTTKTIIVNYRYDKNIGSYWKLADKASTLSQKSEYIDIFVNKLEEENLEGSYDELFLFTPDGNFDENFKALESLQYRLCQIKDMNENTFEYQTAIQQITKQEQGEAQQMIRVIENCYKKVKYPITWRCYIGLANLIYIILVFIGGSMISNHNNIKRSYSESQRLFNHTKRR